MKIFDESHNIHLTSLNNYELYSILASINKYKLKVREGLSINNHFTYAPEIEFICRSYDRAQKLFPKDKFENWTLKKEITIGNGFEITPASFLKNNKKDNNEIKEILHAIKKDPLSYVDYRCGLHMNIGMQAFSDKEHLDRFILLWLAYEEVIFRFCYGDYLNPRKPIISMTIPLRYSINLNNYNNPKNTIYTTKKNAISLYKAKSFNFEYNNVLEIRCPNATLSQITMQNELNLFYHMIECTKEDKFIDMEKIRNNVLKKENIRLESYNKIYLQEAMNFSDIVFDNSLDKYYFLKQYLKNNKEIKYTVQEKMVKYKKI